MALTEAQKRANKKWRDKNKARIREYNADYNREYRNANPEKMALYRKRYYEKRKAFILSLKDGPCVHCGNHFPPVALDFHHVDPSQKDFSIAQLWNQSEERLRAEAEKCILLCACCHRIHHHPDAVTA